MTIRQVQHHDATVINTKPKSIDPPAAIWIKRNLSTYPLWAIQRAPCVSSYINLSTDATKSSMGSMESKSSRGQVK